jgi:CheY-like chemotaxis protein
MEPSRDDSIRSRLPAGSRSPPGAARPPRALVAEDNPVNQRVLVKLLEKRGYSSVVVENGLEALDAFEKEPFDLVLMEIQMPKLDGVEATIAIRAKEEGTGRHTPIIAVTEHAMKGDRESYLAAGVDRYVCKPIAPERLFEAIDELKARSDEPGESAMDTASRVISSEVFKPEETLERFDGDIEFFREVAEQFARDSAELLGRIDAALRAADGRALSHGAHALKGAASNFGASAVVARTATLEKLGAAGDLAAAAAVCEGLAEEVERLNRALREYCARATA